MTLKKARPFMAIVFIQFLYALMSIVAKLALNEGMSPHVLVAYRMAVATALITPFALVLERFVFPFFFFFRPVNTKNIHYQVKTMVSCVSNAGTQDQK